VDLAALLPQATLQPAPRLFLALGIAGLGRRDQPLVILHREFRIHRQPDARAATHRHGDGEIHHVIGVVSQFAIGLEAAHGQDVFEHGAQLRFAPAAARLHIGEQTLDVPDLRRDGLDIAERLLHRRELIDNAGEALLHLLLDRRMQLLVHRCLHLGQALLVAFAQAGELLLVAFAQRGELLVKRGADAALLLDGRLPHGVH